MNYYNKIKKSEKGSSGVGFLGLLGVLFIGLKLTGYIDWSWWLVTIPLWGPIGAVVIIFLLTIFFIGLVKLFE